MAVIEAVPGIEVTICVNGQSLEEYEESHANFIVGNEAVNIPTIVKYIKSTEGQEFNLKYAVKKEHKLDCPCISFQPEIDGISNENQLYIKSTSKLPWTRALRGVRIEDLINGTTRLMPFTFSKINTASNDEAAANLKEQSKKMDKVGQVLVEIWRKRQPEPKKRNISKVTEDDFDLSTVHEKALKGQAKYHSVSLGNARADRAARHYKTTDLDNHPVAIFIFRYRSEEALKHLRILESTPEPEESAPPSPEPPVDLDALDAEQKRRVEEFARSLLRGGTGGPSSSAPKVKREREEEDVKPIMNKKARKSSEKITIDLTDD